jgi:nitrile hydratase
MNGIHDMGGMQGFGPVEPEPNEPPFHSAWEARSLAMNRAMGYAKLWAIDQTRAAIEEFPPHDYLTMSYYQKWALRLEKMLVKLGLVGADEIAAGRALPASRCRALKLADAQR